MTAAKAKAAGTAPAPVDLDARRAARLAASGLKSVRLGGKIWALRAELPMSMLEAFGRGDLRGAVGMILEDPADVDGFLGCDLTVQDFREISGAVYGIDLGKL